MQGMKMGHWLITDEYLESITSLELVCDYLSRVTTNPHYWKWVIIGLHNALQGYMVLALKASNDSNVLTKKCAKKWWAAYWKQNGHYPKRKMDNFMRLYEKIQAGRELYEEELKCGRMLERKSSDLMMMYVRRSQPFKPQGTQTDSVELLHSLLAMNSFISCPRAFP